MTRTLPAVFALLFVIPVSLAAQGVQTRGLEVWGGYGFWGGGDFEDVDGGIRGGVVGMLDVNPRVGFGAELILGRAEERGEEAVVDISEFGLNAVFRYAFGPRGGTHAFAQGRAGWSRLSLNSFRLDGLAIGPEIGVEIPLGTRVRLVIAGGGTWNIYGDAQLDTGSSIGGTGIPDTSASGFQYGARIGIAFGESL
ncbi:MAG: hypothetical protein P8177_04705 [Gemmatimonadota bacterium]|jgi:hypothetical protein